MKVLVVDDNLSLARGLASFLTQEGHEPAVADSVKSAIGSLSSGSFDLVITDLRLPDGAGLEVIKAARSSEPAPEVILMTAYGTVESAVEAMKLGAMDYLTKPVPIEEFAFRVQRIAGIRAITKKADKLKRAHSNLLVKTGYSSAIDNIMGESESMRRVKALIIKAAAYPSTVLLTGETGTGKELAAYAVHQMSPWSDGPFVKVNCASIPETLFESELFGHEKGAFTDAREKRIGRFEAASDGTLFLDEVGEMPLSVQAKLLRTLQDKEIVRVGGSRAINVNTRIVAATNKNLEKSAAAGKFRSDLLYRLAVVKILLPPLRERREDIPCLVDHLLTNFALEFGRPAMNISPDAKAYLAEQLWPGNVRELKNTIERAIVLSESDCLDMDDFSFAKPAALSFRNDGKGLLETLEKMEKELIESALHRNDGIKSRAAEELGISRTNLIYRIKRLGLKLSDD